MIDIGNGFFLLPRQEWGATVSAGRKRVKPITELWAHHSVTAAEDDSNYLATSDVAADMKEIERIGAARFGCFPYSFCQHPSNIIAEGAGWDFLGAHTEGHNSIAIGLAWIGNTNVDDYTTNNCKAFAQLIKYGKKIGKLPQNGQFPTGGHRDTKQTACPGDNLYNSLAKINMYSNQPDVTPPPPVEEDRMISTTIDPTGTVHEVMIGTDHQVYHRYGTPTGIRDQIPQENLEGAAHSIDSYWIGNDFWIVVKGADGMPWYRTYAHASKQWSNWYQGSNAQMA